ADSPSPETTPRTR
nr:immunoglobulin heavy chain junction region [Homo sapiens]